MNIDEDSVKYQINRAGDSMVDWVAQYRAICAIALAIVAAANIIAKAMKECSGKKL